MRVTITNSKAQAIILNELLHSQTSRKHYGMVPLADLRSRLRYELSRKAQDEALLELAGAGAIVLQYHDYAATVPKTERAHFLKHGGVEYFAVSLRT